MTTSPQNLWHVALESRRDGDLTTEMDEVDWFARDCLENLRPLIPAPEDSPIIPIEFFLDQPTAPGWVAFGRVGDHVCLLLDRERAVRPDTATNTTEAGA